MGAYAGLCTAFQVSLVLTACSAVVSPWSRNPVRHVTCASGASSPPFHTTAASTFLPARRCGARSTVSYRQWFRSPRAGPQTTRSPFTQR